MAEATFDINGRAIGTGHPVYIVAEISANHGQDFSQAVALVHAAKNAGADAVKLQTYTPETITIRSDQPWFKISGTAWKDRYLYDLYEEAYTPWQWQPELKTEAERLGLSLFSSPFDATAVDFLEGMQVPAFKIASFEIVDIPLLQKVAATGKPVIISTGMADDEEIREAVNTVKGFGGGPVALLKCTSSYPAPVESMNLRSIPRMAERFGVPVGLSDHSLAIEVPMAAVSLGACIIEKHLTLSRSDGGVDSGFSLEPGEFRRMVEGVRITERALGNAMHGMSDSERSARLLRRSLFVVEDMMAGEAFTARNVRSIRPGHGLHTRHFDAVMGAKAAVAIARGTPLDWALIDR